MENTDNIRAAFPASPKDAIINLAAAPVKRRGEIAGCFADAARLGKLNKEGEMDNNRGRKSQGTPSQLRASAHKKRNRQRRLAQDKAEAARLGINVFEP